MLCQAQHMCDVRIFTSLALNATSIFSVQMRKLGLHEEHFNLPSINH